MGREVARLALGEPVRDVGFVSGGHLGLLVEQQFADQ
jgi:hypothetical protein